MIREHDLDTIFLAGPGHGAPGVLAPLYLEGSYSDTYPDRSQDARGLQRFFKQFSFPGGIGSHCTPETPGSIHEGGELGYSISHAFGAAFDNPSLLVAVVVGDGEAETGPLATSWHGNKFLNPSRDGAVLPILNLNGYKINNPTVLSRIPVAELASLMRGYGWDALFVEGSEPASMHQAMAATLDHALAQIRRIQSEARTSAGPGRRPTWPMIVLRSPKGWTGPATAGGHKVEGTWRAHRYRLPRWRASPKTCASSKPGCAATGRRSYSTPRGARHPSCASFRPKGHAGWAPIPTPMAAYPQGPAPARLSQLRGGRRRARTNHSREYPATRRLPARYHGSQPQQFPRVRS